MSIFLNINSKHLADFIHSARSRVVYAAPGLDDHVASSLINSARKIGRDNVSVVLDISKKVLHFGYGNIDGITLLNEEGIAMQEADGLRIGALIYDNEGLIFTPTPLVIEAEQAEHSRFNAVKASSDQVRNIVAAITPQKIPANSENLDPEIGSDRVPEIGSDRVSEEKIQKVSKAISENPPQQFDVARKVRVFSTVIEFVEIKLKGCEIQRHTVSIPADLLVGNADIETERRLNATFKIVESDSRLSGGSIRSKFQGLKNTYMKSIPKYGHVLLKSKKEKFCQELDEIKKNIEDFQKEVESTLGKEIKKTRKRLMKMLVPSVIENPPKKLLSQIEGQKPTKAQVKKYLKGRFNEIFPCAKDIVAAMSLDCVFKAVTHETISNQEFQNQIEKAYPLIKWEKMLDEYEAAPSTLA